MNDLFRDMPVPVRPRMSEFAVIELLVTVICRENENRVTAQARAVEELPKRTELVSEAAQMARYSARMA